MTEGTGFGSTRGLRVDGKIFAMLMNEQLVVKLPKSRVDEIVASGNGTRLETRGGRAMKEWVAVPLCAQHDWLALAEEAFAFVAGQPLEPSSPAVD